MRARLIRYSADKRREEINDVVNPKTETKCKELLADLNNLQARYDAVGKLVDNGGINFNELHKLKAEVPATYENSADHEADRGKRYARTRDNKPVSLPERLTNFEKYDNALRDIRTQTEVAPALIGIVFQKHTLNNTGTFITPTGASTFNPADYQGKDPQIAKVVALAKQIAAKREDAIGAWGGASPGNKNFTHFVTIEKGLPLSNFEGGLVDYSRKKVELDRDPSNADKKLAVDKALKSLIVYGEQTVSGYDNLKFFGEQVAIKNSPLNKKFGELLKSAEGRNWSSPMPGNRYNHLLGEIHELVQGPKVVLETFVALDAAKPYPAMPSKTTNGAASSAGTLVNSTVVAPPTRGSGTDAFRGTPREDGGYSFHPTGKAGEVFAAYKGWANKAFQDCVAGCLMNGKEHYVGDQTGSQNSTIYNADRRSLVEKLSPRGELQASLVKLRHEFEKEHRVLLNGTDSAAYKAEADKLRLKYGEKALAIVGSFRTEVLSGFEYQTDVRLRPQNYDAKLLGSLLLNDRHIGLNADHIVHKAALNNGTVRVAGTSSSDPAIIARGSISAPTTGGAKGIQPSSPPTAATTTTAPTSSPVVVTTGTNAPTVAHHTQPVFPTSTTIPEQQPTKQQPVALTIDNAQAIAKYKIEGSGLLIFTFADGDRFVYKHYHGGEQTPFGQSRTGALAEKGIILKETGKSDAGNPIFEITLTRSINATLDTAGNGTYKLAVEPSATREQNQIRFEAAKRLGVDKWHATIPGGSAKFDYMYSSTHDRLYARLKEDPTKLFGLNSAANTWHTIEAKDLPTVKASAVQAAIIPPSATPPPTLSTETRQPLVTYYARQGEILTFNLNNTRIIYNARTETFLSADGKERLDAAGIKISKVYRPGEPGMFDSRIDCTLSNVKFHIEAGDVKNHHVDVEKHLPGGKPGTYIQSQEEQVVAASPDEALNGRLLAASKAVKLDTWQTLPEGKVHPAGEVKYAYSTEHKMMYAKSADGARFYAYEERTKSWHTITGPKLPSKLFLAV